MANDRATTEPPPTERLWDDVRLGSVHTQADKSERVRRMFNAIAPTYEFINALFSGGRDRAWRRRAVRLARVAPGDAVLDIACGTGDVLRAFERWGGPVGALVGLDFAHAMLVRAAARSSAKLRWCEGDALRLPFADASFDVVSCAFGVRNFQGLDVGLREMRRVLRPGGRVVILEFSRPPNRLVRWVYELYAARIMPAMASLISRDRTGAYRYLPSSVVSFVGSSELRDRLCEAGFAQAEAAPMTLGVVTIYVATKGTA